MKPPDSDLFYNILFLIALIMLNAFFAMSEMAIVSLNDNKVRKMAQDGNKKAAKIISLVKSPTKFLATIQVGVTLSGFLASAVAADSFSEYIVYALRNAEISPTTVKAFSILGITMVLSYFTLVFGELVPKRIAMQHSEKISFAVAPLLSFFSLMGKPFVALLSVSTNAVLRLLHINPDEKPDQVTEEEIRMMIDVGNESGNIEQSDKDMINNIFEFDDRTADEMMTHRTEVVAVELGTSIDKIIALVVDTGYSRLPIYEDDLDSIVGILYVKDLLKLVLESADQDFDLNDYVRVPLYVLESTSCKDLLREFKEKKIQVAIVVDEYGGTSGMVTMEDLLESIVGNIQDEYDDEDEYFCMISEGEWIIDGLTPLENVEKQFDIYVVDDEDFDTIGGYMMSQLGYIPSEEERPFVEIGGYVFTVSEMEDRRISKIHAKIIAKNQELAKDTL